MLKSGFKFKYLHINIYTVINRRGIGLKFGNILLLKFKVILFDVNFSRLIHRDWSFRISRSMS
jgi:hypothetical protein